MNLALLDAQNTGRIPEQILFELREDGLARMVALNRDASLLAVGAQDGRVIIWDFYTQGISKVMVGHSHTVTAISWSRDGRKLLTASTDWKVIIWDVEEGTIQTSHLLSASIYTAQIHPKNKNLCIACPYQSDPVLIDLDTLKQRVIPLPEDETQINNNIQPQDRAEMLDDTSSMEIDNASSKSTEGQSQKTGINASQKKNSSTNQLTPVAIFDHTGELIYVSDYSGRISIVDIETWTVKQTFRPCNNQTTFVKGMVASKDGRNLLLNCSDRVVRLWDLQKNENAKELSDAVNKAQWKTICFSADGEQVLAGSAQRHEHKIYIWDALSGTLVKFLEGPKEGVMDLTWHPNQAIVVSTSTLGTVYVWGIHQEETWSAFAPGFTVLEDSEEYIEREDEFDITDEPLIHTNKKPKYAEEDEDEVIDITGVDTGNDSSDVDEPFHLSVSVLPDPLLLSQVPNGVSHPESSKKSKACR